jgi:hypothetical protein
MLLFPNCTLKCGFDWTITDCRYSPVHQLLIRLPSNREAVTADEALFEASV